MQLARTRGHGGIGDGHLRAKDYLREVAAPVGRLGHRPRGLVDIGGHDETADRALVQVGEQVALD
jgi:hypothetical protein